MYSFPEQRKDGMLYSCLETDFLKGSRATGEKKIMRLLVESQESSGRNLFLNERTVQRNSQERFYTSYYFTTNMINAWKLWEALIRKMADEAIR
jgi:hypothetical protein